MKSGMVDMVLTPEDLKKQAGMPTMSTDDVEKYPWGLRITLNEDELTKLGIKDLPAVGEPFTIEAVGYTCDTSESETEGGKRRCLSIQITDLEIEEGVEEDDEDEEQASGRRAERMYPAESGENKA